MIVAILVAGIRLGIIFYERHEAGIEPAKKQAPPLNPDYYVTPKKLYPYNLKSAKQLTQQPAWVKVGYYYPYYSYDPATRHADLFREAGKLLPLQKLDIKDVIAAPSPRNPGEQQILAIFERDGKRYADLDPCRLLRQLLRRLQIVGIKLFGSDVIIRVERRRLFFCRLNGCFVPLIENDSQANAGNQDRNDH